MISSKILQVSMTRFVFRILIGAFLLMAQSAFAGKVCLQSNLGGYFELKGGKPDKKTYTVKIIEPGLYIAGGYADVTSNSAGEYKIAIYSGHDLNQIWSPVLYSTTGDENFNSVGTYDLYADGSIDGNVTFTNIPCSSLPPGRPAFDKNEISPQSLSKEFCFNDNFGNLYNFKGGKLGKKAFATEVFHANCGVLPGITTFIKREDGTFNATAIIGEDPGGVCNPFEITASFSGSMVSGNGNFDNFPRESDPDGTISFTAFDCANFTSGMEKEPVAPISGPGSNE
jgi:hypothetical protein